jgi:hypothetical protein
MSKRQRDAFDQLFDQRYLIKAKLLEKFKNGLSKEKLDDIENDEWTPGFQSTDPTDLNHNRMLGLEYINGIWTIEWIRMFVGDWQVVPFTTDLCILKSLWNRNGEGIQSLEQIKLCPQNWQTFSDYENLIKEQVDAFCKFIL